VGSADPGPQNYDFRVEAIESILGPRLRITITVPAHRDLDGTEHVEKSVTICPSVQQWWSIVNEVGEVADAVWGEIVETN
jgi:hypothetical protein